MSNLIHEEQVLVQDIFLIKVRLDAPSLNNGTETIFLKDFSNDISKCGANFSLVKNDSLFDSMLMERLSMPNSNVLEYLGACFNRAQD